MIIFISFCSIFLLGGIVEAPSAMAENLTLHKPQNTDASALTEFHDIMGPVTMAEPTNWPLLFAVALGIIALILLLLWWKKRTPTHPLVSPKKQALNNLNRLDPQMDAPSQYIDEISSIVRGYIHAEYAIPCPERTSHEFLLSLDDSALAEKSDQLKTLFLFWDMVKFSGLQPSIEELKKHHGDVERFIKGGDDALSAP